MSRYNYSRRPSRQVMIAGHRLGGDAPIRVQSMTNLSTNDVAGCIAQCARIIDAGGDLVRLTTQGVREADNIGLVRAGLHERGYGTPVVADVHFNQKAAFRAAETCDKVRINPGNFADAARTFKQLEYTDAEYAAELKRIEEALVPFLETCRAHRTAIRLGINHGSLSDRIMSRYGDSPAGMTESAMEYLRICRAHDFNNVVISMKASNPVVMVEAVRLLVAAMDAEGMNYPLHLGVTEAGDGEEARIKSAMGIGALLADGIGDTVRVSLSEDPVNEIPVGRDLVAYVTARANAPHVPEPEGDAPKLPLTGRPLALHADKPDTTGWHHVEATSEPALFADNEPVILTARKGNIPGQLMSWIDRFRLSGGKNPVVVEAVYTVPDKAKVQLMAAADLGPVLMNGYANSLSIEAPYDMADTELAILQGARLRFSKTEYIACPGCGRTMFDLQGTLKAVKEATAHLTGLKIGVMGCIVNGPGEMADADYGYVGAAAGRVSLYRGKECIEKNIPQEEAIPRLLDLIARERKL